MIYKPFYELQEQDKEYIVKMVQACEEIGLSNCNYQYYYSKTNKNEMFFYLVEFNEYWQLVVKHACNRLGDYITCTDIYEVRQGVICYKYSEED